MLSKLLRLDIDKTLQKPEKPAFSNSNGEDAGQHWPGIFLNTNIYNNNIGYFYWLLTLRLRTHLLISKFVNCALLYAKFEIVSKFMCI